MALTHAQRRAAQAQAQRLMKKERRLLRRRDRAVPLNALAEKAPEKARAALQKAFYEGFRVVFTKGAPWIERTYSSEKARTAFEGRDSAVQSGMSARSFRRLDKGALRSARLDTSISTAEGALLGLLGIGLPDIPIFIGMLLRTVYRTAQCYGFTCHSIQECDMVLYILCMAFSHGEKRREYSAAVDGVMRDLRIGLPSGVDYDALMEETAGCLAASLTAAKLVQGLPLVGVAGAVSNNCAVRAVAEVARVKYKKRYLSGLMEETECARVEDTAEGEE